MPKKTKDQEEEKIKLDLNLKNSVKKGISIVLLFLLAILFSFGFFGAGGAFGEFLNKVGGMFFGWGKWLFPITLLLMAMILLLNKKTVFYVVKIIGLSIAFLSLLGFFHIFFDAKEFLPIAESGQGGGYVGYFIALGLIKFTGKIAGILVLVAFLAIGIMIAFDFSLVEFFIKLFKRKENQQEKETVQEEVQEGIMENKNPEIQEEKISEPENVEEVLPSDEECNIKEIKFVEGPLIESKKEEEDEIEEEDYDDEEEFEEEAEARPARKRGRKRKWRLPSLNLLDEFNGEADGGNIEERIDIIKDTFSNFGIELGFHDCKTGPSVTQYSFRPAVGVKLSKIVAYGDDLALALAAHPIRIEAPIPGKSLIGIEVPNKKPIPVRLRNALENKEFKSNAVPLNLALGKDVEGNFVSADLGKMPHLLIAGATGTGKSVCINSIILSLLFKNSPEDLKMILVDPKRVELSLYNKIPHLLSDVITDNKKVVNALRWAVREMENRYKILESVGSRDLESYNEKLKEGGVREFIDPETGELVEEEMKKLPFIVIIIDELADLMLSHGKDVEGAIMRLAQMARAVGIHLIISTQRPSVEIITGIIKANISNRIALQVNSQVDSRTILDMRGAENLLGKGDLLFISAQSPRPKRLQNPFVSESEVKRVVEFIRNQEKERGGDELENEFEELEPGENSQPQNSFANSSQMDFSASEEDKDTLYEEAKEFVITAKRASASLLQRKFRIGYNRAARLIECLEEDGIVGPPDGAKPREVLVADEGRGNADETDDVTQEQRDKWQI